MYCLSAQALHLYCLRESGLLGCLLPGRHGLLFFQRTGFPLIQREGAGLWLTAEKPVVAADIISKSPGALQRCDAEEHSGWALHWAEGVTACAGQTGAASGNTHWWTLAGHLGSNQQKTAGEGHNSESTLVLISECTVWSQLFQLMEWNNATTACVRCMSTLCAGGPGATRLPLPLP